MFGLPGSRKNRSLPPLSKNPHSAAPAMCFQVCRPSVCTIRPYVKTCFACRDISTLSGGISMKLGKNFYRVRALLNSFQGQRSKVKVMTRQINLSSRRHTFCLCGVKARLFYLFIYLENSQFHAQYTTKTLYKQVRYEN